LRCTVEKIDVASRGHSDVVSRFDSEIFPITTSRGKRESPFLRNFPCGEGLSLLDVWACAQAARLNQAVAGHPLPLALDYHHRVFCPLRWRKAHLAISESTAHRYTLQDPDVRLMLQVRDDDNAAAFEELMIRYQNRLVSLLAHQVGRRDMAEDLAQDVFLRVYRSRERYVPGAKFSTWLFTIANNVALNAMRTLARRKEVNLAAPSAAETGANPIEVRALAASGLMPTRQFDKAELLQIIQRAIETLNDRQRMAVLLCKFEHMSYVEIGEIMEMTPQAIKSLLSRARSKLREVIEPYVT